MSNIVTWRLVIRFLHESEFMVELDKVCPIWRSMCGRNASQNALISQRDMTSMDALIVDDDQEIRETLRLVLEDAGYTVKEAPDGNAALRQLEASQNSMVVLLDLMMPALDGAGVLRVVSSKPELAKRHAYVLMTALHATFPLPFVQLLSTLSVPVLHKPIDIDHLLEALRRAEQRIPAKK